MRFVVTTDSKDPLDLCRICNDFANNLWVPTHLSPEQAEQFVLDQFRRTVLAELELLDITAMQATV